MDQYSITQIVAEPKWVVPCRAEPPVCSGLVSLSDDNAARAARDTTSAICIRFPALPTSSAPLTSHAAALQRLRRRDSRVVPQAILAPGRARCLGVPPPPTRSYFCLPYSAPPARHATTFVATPPSNRDVRHPSRGLSKPTPFALRCSCKPRHLRRHAALAHSVLACCGRLPSPGTLPSPTPYAINHRAWLFCNTRI